MKEGSFNVKLDYSESIVSLSEKAKSGIPVSKTPHVGNWRPDNMSWADEYILNIAYDRTLGCKDHNFFPHTIIKGGKYKQIVDPNILSTHSDLVDVHMGVLKKLYPNARIDTFTDWIHMHKAYITVMLDILGEKSIELGIWNRFVDEEGRVYKKTPVNYKAVISEGVFNIHSDQRGWIWSNAFNVVLLAVVDSIKHSGTDEVWHVSGPDMYNYIGKMSNDLQKIYELLAGQHLDDQNKIPEEITMRLHVAGFYNRFTVPQDKKEGLDQFFDAVYEYAAAKEEKVDAFRRRNMGERVNVDAFKDNERNTFKRLVDATNSLANILFYDMYREKNGLPKKLRPSYFSQHDAIDAGAVYTHPTARKMSSKDIRELHKLLLNVEMRIKNS